MRYSDILLNSSVENFVKLTTLCTLNSLIFHIYWVQEVQDSWNIWCCSQQDTGHFTLFKRLNICDCGHLASTTSIDHNTRNVANCDEN